MWKRMKRAWRNIRGSLANRLRQFADSELRNENARLVSEADELRVEIETLEARLAVRDAEIQELTAVVARNLQRVAAETAIASREVVNAEAGTPPE